MSNVNIKRAVENIKSNTTIFTPIIEIIVNAIQAIEASDNKSGVVEVRVERSKQSELDDSLPEIVSFKILDNGIGFNQKNRKSFDTLYSDHKIEQGGKGFGRFICLKYFEHLRVSSVYFEDGYRCRIFEMGKDNDIIVNEIDNETDIKNTGSSISLIGVKSNSLNKKLSTIARSLVEILLPYFIKEDYQCPDVILMEEDGSGALILNDYIRSDAAVIKEVVIENNEFVLGKDDFTKIFYVRIFKIYSPKNKVSKINLVADKRSVTESSIHAYIPEFIEEFYDKDSSGTDSKDRNYILKTYVFGSFLDENVSLERGDFKFQKENDMLYGISQNEIESKAAEITKEAVIDDISNRQDKKRDRIGSYVDEEAPWHREILKDIDLSSFPYNPTNEEIEIKLQREKFNREVGIRNKVNALLADSDADNVKANVSEIVAMISDSSKNDLIHYVAMRKNVLELFSKSLAIDASGKYSSESLVHEIIFPMRKDSDSVSFSDHNLWIIDERLNFTNYVSSDLPLNGSGSERPDLLIYNHRVAFRGDNESSNPITIFEFKKPNRDDFVNPSSKEDPVMQIVRYVNSIRGGSFKTPDGRKMNIAQNTPFYGYVVCELSAKVEEWLEFEKNFTPMPDRMGWFQWYGNINLYIEVVSWEKLLKDSNMRNKIFFHQLGI